MNHGLVVSAGVRARPVPILKSAAAPDPKMHFRVVGRDTGAVRERGLTRLLTPLGFVSGVLILRLASA